MPNRHGVAYSTDAGRRYESYINSKAWAKKRQQYWKEFGRSCKVADCGATAGLHVHHHTYDRLGEELMSDLVGLCEQHHDQVHDVYEKERNQRSLTSVTERVTGIKLTRTTRVQASKPPKPPKAKVRKHTISEIEELHRNKPPKNKCKCRSCESRAESTVKVGRKISPLDSFSWENQQTKKPRAKRVLNNSEAKKQIAKDRKVRADRFRQAQEVARRIAAGRSN